MGLVLLAVALVLQAVLMVLTVCQVPMQVGLVFWSIGPVVARLLLSASCKGGAPAVMPFVHGALV